MDLQTQTQGAQLPQVGSNQSSYTATDGTQLNPTAVTLAKAIRQVESNGNYNAVGDSGESHGAYQFNKNNFQNWASEYGLDPNDFSPTNQDKVAYSRINALLKKGVPPSQVAAIWNGASYQNGQYQALNPGYVNKVKSAYQQITGNTSEGQGAQQMLKPGVPALKLDTTPSSQDKGFLNNLFSGNILGAGKDAFDWAFPIVGDLVNDVQGKSQKSALQQLGDAGLSALWFVPGFGEGAGVLESALKGGALGYGAGALSNLSQGQGILQSLSPNLSNITGAITGGVAGGVLSKIASKLGGSVTEEGAVQSLSDNLESSIGATKSGSKFLAASAQRGFDPADLLSKSMAIPDIVDGRIVAAPAKEIINKAIADLGETRATALDKIGTTIPLEDLRNEALAQVKNMAATGETQKMESQINNVFNDFKINYGENLSASQLESIKEAQAASSGIYKRTGQIGEQNASSIIGNVARSKIENLAADSDLPGMKEFNNLIAQHYNALDALDKIDGQVVKGGRLGNMLRGHTIAAVSALGANAMGGGFLGTLAAALGGEGANSLLSKIIGETSYTNPLRQAVLNSIETKNPEIVQKLMDALGLTGKIAPQLAPKAATLGNKAMGLLSNLLTKAAGIGGATITAGQ